MISFVLGLFAGIFIAVLMYIVLYATAEDDAVDTYYNIVDWGDDN